MARTNVLARLLVFPCHPHVIRGMPALIVLRRLHIIRKSPADHFRFHVRHPGEGSYPVNAIGLPTNPGFEFRVPLGQNPARVSMARERVPAKNGNPRNDKHTDPDCTLQQNSPFPVRSPYPQGSRLKSGKTTVKLSPQSFCGLGSTWSQKQKSAGGVAARRSATGLNVLSSRQTGPIQLRQAQRPFRSRSDRSAPSCLI